jgi:hypothetical protein
MSLVDRITFMFYALYALGFIFRNRGPLQKVCRDADTHARPQLPPGAAQHILKEYEQPGSCHVTKLKFPRPDGGIN